MALLGGGSSGGVEHFQGPLGADRIGGGDAVSGAGVSAGQQGMAAGLAQGPELGPQVRLRRDRRGAQSLQ